MTHAITVGDLVHWSLFAAFIATGIVDLVMWAQAAGQAMSDAPQYDDTPAWFFWALHLIPVGFLVAWWLT